MAEVIDISGKCFCMWCTVVVEDPGDNFVFLRDYVDCINCRTLKEFAPEKLSEGFTSEMKAAARTVFKINSVCFL